MRVVAANNGNSALTVVVPAGKTKFEVQNFVVAMVIDKERIVQIASHKNATFTVPQEGTACLASGKVSWTNRGNTARYEEALFGACPHKSAKPRNLKNH